MTGRDGKCIFVTTERDGTFFFLDGTGRYRFYSRRDETVHIFDSTERDGTHSFAQQDETVLKLFPLF